MDPKFIEGRNELLTAVVDKRISPLGDEFIKFCAGHWSDPLRKADLLTCLGNLGVQHDARKAFSEAVERAINGSKSDPAAAQPEDWPEYEPLPAVLPPVTPFAFELLPGVLRERVRDIANRMQCPPDFVAVAYMTAISSVIGRQVGIRPKRRDDWLVVPNLFGMSVGRPGVLKTPALDEAVKDLRRLEAKAKNAYEEERDAYEADVRVARARAKEVEKAIGKALRDGKPSDAQRLAQEEQKATPQPAKRERFITNDATVEKLGELLADSGRCIMVYRDELSGLLKAMDREDHKEDRAFYLEAWGGTASVFTYDRIGRGTIDIPYPCVSILGGIQPSVLQSYVMTAVTGGNGDDGLLQRFQLAVWPDISNTWENVDEWPNKESKEAVSALFDRLANLDTSKVQTDEYGSIPFLRFSDDAQDQFTKWRTALERRIRKGELAPAFESHLAKYRSLVPSLALICELIDNEAPASVGKASLLRALAWAQYLESHAERIYAVGQHGDIAVAIELHKRILSGAIESPFTARDVYRKCWTLLDKDNTDRAIRCLEDFGHIRVSRAPQTTGRPRVEWEIHPALTEKKKISNEGGTH